MWAAGELLTNSTGSPGPRAPSACRRRHAPTRGRAPQGWGKPRAPAAPHPRARSLLSHTRGRSAVLPWSPPPPRPPSPGCGFILSCCPHQPASLLSLPHPPLHPIAPHTDSTPLHNPPLPSLRGSLHLLRTCSECGARTGHLVLRAPLPGLLRSGSPGCRAQCEFGDLLTVGTALVFPFERGMVIKWQASHGPSRDSQCGTGTSC